MLLVLVIMTNTKTLVILLHQNIENFLSGLVSNT